MSAAKRVALAALALSWLSVRAQTVETELRERLETAATAQTKSRMRRAYKKVARDGLAMCAGSTEPSRYRILGVVLQAQKRLLQLERSPENQAALLKTCSQLAAAPDEMALWRLEADMLLSESDLSSRGANVEQRAHALAELIARYRDTPGEAKSLMMAGLIAPKLEAFELEGEIDRTLTERFAGDHAVIEWRRRHRDFSHLPVQFTGTLQRADGREVSFPTDRLGHTCLIYFWSTRSPDVDERLAEIESIRARFPEQVEVFSLNLDELADAGEAELQKRGLDWIALRLPGGRESQIYRAYAVRDPFCIRVNAHGHSFISASQTRTIAEEAPIEQNFDDARYLSQLQAVFVGDFLLGSVPSASSAPSPSEPGFEASTPAATLAAIQSCFVPAPHRYRLTETEALRNYVTADELCREAIAAHPEASDLWRVRNRRIVALLGRWNLEIEPRYLAMAVEEARTVLATAHPPAAAVVPRFCLAKQAFREDFSRRSVEQVVESFVQELGDQNARVLAAASILAMEANVLDRHRSYRAALLSLPGDDASLWPIRTFLADQNHSYRVCKPNLYLPPSRARRIERSRLRANAATLDGPPIVTGPIRVRLSALDVSAPEGGVLTLADERPTLLMFVEPPPADEELPIAIGGGTQTDAHGRDRQVLGAMQRAFALAEEEAGRQVRVVAAFLTDDRERVQRLMKARRWPCPIALVPRGLESQLVRQLGILSADRVPNAVLLRADGTIAWSLSGIVHPQLRSEGISERLHVIERALRAQFQALPDLSKATPGGGKR